MFAAVHGTTTIRTSSGALIVTATSQMAGATASVFVCAQGRARILFSVAAVSGPFAATGLLKQRGRYFTALSAPKSLRFDLDKCVGRSGVPA